MWIAPCVKYKKQITLRIPYLEYVKCDACSTDHGLFLSITFVHTYFKLSKGAWLTEVTV